jgi:prepilin-type processing-associated H-X9-DG protein
MGKIRNPAGTPMLFDSNCGWNSTLPVTGAVPRHSEGYNCGFVDGHVKWVKGQALGFRI